MTLPATSTPVDISIPSRPGELLTSSTTGPWFERISRRRRRRGRPTWRRASRSALLRGQLHLDSRCRRGGCSSGTRPGGAVRSIAATTRLPTTKARMSEPRDSLMNSWTRMSASSSRNAPITDSAALRVSARTTPLPWVPWSSLTTIGGAADRFEDAVDVLDVVGEAGDGEPIPARASSCSCRSLSWARLIACDSFDRERAHHLELADDRGAVEGVAGADPRDHRVEAARPARP